MPAHAPPARPTAGYTVMSWHCVSVRGANGDATPYFLASASTCERYDAESALLDDVVSAPSDWTEVSKLTRAESSLRDRRARVAAPASAAATTSPRPAALRDRRCRARDHRGHRPAFTPKTFANESIDDWQRAVSAARGARRQSRQLFTRRVELSRVARLAAVSSGDAP